MNWELICFISLGFLTLIMHVIPCLIAIYYLIKERQWFLLLPLGVMFAVPMLGTLASWVQVISEGEEFNVGDMPLLIQIIFLGPLNLLVFSTIMMSIC